MDRQGHTVNRRELPARIEVPLAFSSDQNRTADSMNQSPSLSEELEIVIASTFTADLVQPPLAFWMKSLNIGASTTIFPYGQLMQGLLDPESSLNRNSRGFNILLIRLQDLIRDKTSSRNIADDQVHLQQSVSELISAIEKMTERSSATLFIFLCASSSSSPAELSTCLEFEENQMVERIKLIGKSHCWQHSDLMSLYPVQDHEDAIADRIAHIPYTQDYFTAIATLLARRVAALVKPQYKVIAVDCDNTLWGGICGEVGARGVSFTEAHLQLQTLLVRQHNAGMLICICSKNNAADVDAVFESRPEMILRAEHVIASKINWEPKSANLQDLAHEFGLSLDSFIFIDDSPVECVEVKSNCPSVLTLQLPDSQEVSNFLRHVWAFDRIGPTEEAHDRTRKYKEEFARRAARQRSGDLRKFIESLGQSIDISQAKQEDVIRITELIQRTNQFNLTNIRRRRDEVDHILKTPELEVLVVRVCDRFGDYGLVGALLLRRGALTVELDTFVLSCRVLGRGVEHRIFSALGSSAVNQGQHTLSIRCRTTTRNQPAQDFLEAAFGEFRTANDAGGSADERVYSVPAEYAARLSTTWTDRDSDRGRRIQPIADGTMMDSKGEHWPETALRLSLTSDVAREMGLTKSRSKKSILENQLTPMEEKIAEIFSEVLGVDAIDPHADFFDIGGNSIKAVQFIVRIESSLGLELSLLDFFESPTVAQISSMLADAGAAAPPITHIDRIGPMPLSYAQERLWFLDQVGLVGTAYNVPLTLRLRGNLNADALEKSLDELIHRHEILRTRFLVRDGVPRQLISPASDFKLLRADLTPLHESDLLESDLQDLMRAEHLHHFDLAAGHLFRAVLVTLGSGEYALLITMHHIVSDGWSFGILVRELSALYSTQALGAPYSLPPLEIQYIDYAIWQRQWLSPTVIKDHLEYWREYLQGIPEQIQLPTDRPRPAVESFKGDTARFELPADLCGALNRLGREQGATLFMVVLAAYQLLLSRWSGQTDIVVGSPIAGRRNRETEKLIGFFVNTLTFRTVISMHGTFRKLLGQVKSMALGAYAHQDIPFEMLVKDLRPERNLSRQPLFQTMLALQNYPEEQLDIAGLEWRWGGAYHTTTHFDLTLYLFEVSDKLVGTFEYSTDLFDKQTITGLATSFHALLDGIVANPDRPVCDIPLMSDSERKRLVVDLNATYSFYPSDRCIHDLFYDCVVRNPNSPAVTFRSKSLSYAELDSWANRLACEIANVGVGVDTIVAVYLERSIEMIVSLLAILKAGGAYLPIDSSLPRDRIQFMLEDARIGFALTTEGWSQRLPANNLRIICVDRSDAFQRWPPNAPETCARPDNLAYALYTSGTTGRPKTVGVTHRNVVRLLIGTDYIGLDKKDVLLQLAAPAFDASTFEIWGALLHGAKLVLYPDREVDLERLQQVLEGHDVSILWLTAGLFQQVIDERPHALAKVRTLLTGGDVLSPNHVRRAVRHLPDCQLINGYGPTEATTFSVCHRISDDSLAEATIPIGRPIANTQVYVLDEQLGVVPVGVSGELFIGGDGVARGYLGHAELTAARFVANPFGPNGSRLYRTGDLVRWRSKGFLEFIGRTDNQVKIRGYRIEPMEIESSLLEHPAVKQAVVLVKAGDSGDKRLVCYLVGDRSAVAPSASDELFGEVRNTVVGEWEALYEETYGSANQDNPNFVGWNSSYTNQPIPDDEMREWLNCTLERIKHLRPNRVLEIGCGVGLLLQHLAPQCERYVGTDFSAAALNRLRRWMYGKDELRHVELRHEPADEIRNLERGSFDTVIINSVIQYFPDIEYLVMVLREAAQLVRHGGTIFLGDIRHLGLLPTFHAAVQLTRAAATTTVGQLKRRIARAIAQDKELVIDPEFFLVLPGNLPNICGAEVQWKRGRTHNELTRYRYDVTLRIGPGMNRMGVAQTFDWNSEVRTLANLRILLGENCYRFVCISGVPNYRLARDKFAQKLIDEGSDDTIPVFNLRRRLNEAQLEGVEPEDISDLADSLGYVALVRPTTNEQFEVELFYPAGDGDLLQAISEPPPARQWSAYSNDPLESGIRQHLIPILRQYLKEQLPEYMIPSSWIVLKQLPLTVNGKIDRRALPAPQGRPEELGEYVAPKTKIEQTLADIWVQLLPVDQVGTNDNFFELGGHSLLIVQMMEQLRRIGLRASVRDVYERPRLEDLARALIPDTSNSSGAEATAPTPNPSSVISDPLIQLTSAQLEQIAKIAPGGVENIQDIYPLGPLQGGMFFHHLASEDGDDSYTRAFLLSLPSKAQLLKFIEALQCVINRHDILRTAFFWRGLPEPVQVVYREAALRVEEIQLTPTVNAVGQLEERLNSSRKMLDLHRAPLIKLQTAADPSAQTWYAILQTHHIIFDNQSLQMMFAEVAAVLGQSAHLGTPIQYRDYIARYLQYVRTTDLAGHFKEKLAGIDEPTLPFGKADVHRNGTQIIRATHAVEPRLSSRIRASARNLKVTPAILFHAAWALVISRTSGREDIVFGTVLLGRHQGTEGMTQGLGVFINTLPLRLDMSGLTAKGLVYRTHEELADLLRHEMAPLVQAQRCSGISGSRPLFSALLNYVRSSPQHMFDGLDTTNLQVLASRGGTNYPISLTIYDHDNAFYLTMETDPSIRPLRLIEYALTAMSALIDLVELSPDAPASDISILPAAESKRITADFNSTHRDFPDNEVIDVIFSKQALLTPTAIAVSREGETLTFADLNLRSTQLAHFLQRKGIAAEQLVGIYLDRCIDMVVAFLGVLKSGGAYVPMDPSNPSERVEFVLSDSRARMLLTHERFKKRIPSIGAEIVAIDSEWSQITQAGALDSAAEAASRSAQNLAYVIYTSGSTGKPKGVMISHQNVINYSVHAAHQFDIPRGSGSLICTSISFDLMLTGLYPALLSGAAVRLCPEEHGLPNFPSELASCNNLAPLKLTPSHLPMLDKQLRNGDLTGKIGVLVLGGEPLHGSMVQPWKQHSPLTRIFNHYGPTETTIGCAVLEILEDEVGPLPIGRPISNTQIYILDCHMRPVPIGVVGEIHVGGAGVGRGYFHRPALSSERFLPDPFNSKPGARLYKTGDLGRWRPDGKIEYIGRNDSQIKIRGFRIELGEIETLLLQHEEVVEAIVVAHEDALGERRLVAYLTLSSQSSPNVVDALRSVLKRRLPDYMVPATFVVLERIPLTPNGKVDRRSLPLPELRSHANRQYEPPGNETERNLALIWKEVLQVDLIGQHDNFFEIGGHSLLVLKALFRINNLHGTDLKVGDFYRNPTLSELAARISGNKVEDRFVDLEREAVLDPDIVACAGQPMSPQGAVLLTGATGFVGRFVLSELLSTSDRAIFCVIRAQSTHEASSKLKAALLRWGLWQEHTSKRITAVPGDLRLSRLGIDEAMYRSLAQTVDSIFHCATSMNHLETYAMAKPVNVGGLVDVIRFATFGRPKLLNVVSTLSILGSPLVSHPNTIDERSSIDHEKHRFSSGYLASKWVGEKLCILARERDIPVNIFRLGLVWADTQQGRYDELQRECRLLTTCLQTGYGIKDYKYERSPTPVDCVARAIVLLANQHSIGGGVFHISSPRSDGEGIFERINRITDAGLELKTRFEWVGEIKRLHENGRSTPIVPLIEFAFSMDEESFYAHEYNDLTRRNVVDCTRTITQLMDAGYVVPELDDRILKVTVEYLRSGWQDLPKGDALASGMHWPS